MNKVVTINLHGAAFQLEEAGYDALRAYLDGAASRLEGNPDKDEIVADIEQAIADKCRAALGAYKNVVLTEEISRIIDEMGPVEDAGAQNEEHTAAAGGGASGSQAQTPPPSVRRVYKIPEGAMLFGVCNGLGVYFGIDPTLVRLLFVLITFLWGFGALVYLVLAIILPSPQSAAEKAAAFGLPATAREFIRRAREGYYEGIRTLPDRHAHREWRRQFKREMKGWGRRLRHEARAHAYRMAASAGQTSWTPGPPPPAWTPGPSTPWTPGPPAPFGLLILLPIVAILRGVLAVAGFFAVISLLATHTVFGVAPPEGMPLWVALILLFVILSLVAWPLKALRHAWYWHAARGPVFVPPLFWALDAIIGIGCVVLAFWLIDRYVPQAHEALQALPSLFHQLVETVRQWWTSH